MTATVTTASTTLERIADGSRFEALQSEWNELVAASDSACLFLTWGWLHTWWKHLAGDRKLAILTVREEGRLMALAPLCERPASIWERRPLAVLEFLGTGLVGSDYLDFIVRRGFEADARRVLGAFLAEDRRVFDWGQLRRGSCFAACVAAELASREWTVTERVINTCPYIPLAGKSWEDYLATLGAEHRYNFNRKWRRLKKDYTVQFEQTAGAEQCAASIDLAIALHNARWRGRGRSDAFHTRALVEFHREFSQFALSSGWLRLYVLRLNQKPAACLYGFLYGKTFYFYQSGFDPEYQKQSVGLVAMGLGIQSAIGDGADEYDLLHGDEEYKSHWAHERRELARMEAYPPGGMGRLCQRSTQLERASRRLARRVLTRIA